MNCGSGCFAIDSTSQLEGTVDTSFLGPNDCKDNTSSKVIFRIEYAGSSGSEDICTVPYPGCKPGFHQKNDQQCQCESSSGMINTYQLLFYFNENYVGANLSITTECQHTGQHVFTHTDCTDLELAPAEYPPESDNEEEMKRSAVITIGAVAILLAFIICVLVVRKFWHGGQESGTKTSTPREDPDDNVAKEEPETDDDQSEQATSEELTGSTVDLEPPTEQSTSAFETTTSED
ncbi:uncharacterized protein LOC143275741 [Babylonia areolata]|uniref:uncharacterized protein LOC143275741 n=1 Tax=Babylonia areolata TaxID=304850 RepID=UPI003FD2AE6B